MKMIYAVTGNPVLHSRSPEIFNSLFKRYGIGAFYTRLAAGTAEGAFHLARSLNIRGINITSPFKKEAFLRADKCDDGSTATGSVNTAILNKNTVSGYNTDHIAVKQIFVNNLHPGTRPDILILGAGGAAEAAAFALRDSGNNVTILNRNIKKAESIAVKYGFSCNNLEAVKSLAASANFIISTIPRGIIESLMTFFVKKSVFIDAVYHNSGIEEICMEKGINYIGGLEWLKRQALPAFRLFTGKEASYNDLAGIKQIKEHKQRNIILSGFMGSGKTTLGKLIADKSGFEFIDTDEMIEKNENLTIPEIFRKYGERYFRERETQTLSDILKLTKNVNKQYIISAGGGAPAFHHNREILANFGVRIFLYVPPDESVKRIKHTTRPLLKNHVEGNNIGKLFQKRLPDYLENSDLVIDNSGNTGDTAKRICDEIENYFGK